MKRIFKRKPNLNNKEAVRKFLINSIEADDLVQQLWQQNLIDYEMVGSILYDYASEKAKKKMFKEIFKDLYTDEKNTVLANAAKLYNFSYNGSYFYPENYLEEPEEEM